METKYVRVPFEVELAKKITDKSVDGRIVTNLGKEVRIVCFDMLNEKYPIVGLRKDDNYTETALSFNLNGQCLQISENNDLFLEPPEYMTFKDGDVIFKEKDMTRDGYIFREIGIINKSSNSNVNDLLFYAVFTFEFDYDFISLDFDKIDNDFETIRLATEEEKQELIEVLKASKDERAKEYLKRFFGIEVKQEYEFKPFDKVLGRECETDKWRADLFSHMNKEGEFICIGYVWEQCIPYNEQTAHLLGTTENYEYKF